MNNKKIALIRIEKEDIQAAVFKSLNLISADKLFNSSNMTVLLKPNILGGKQPERAVTTHPEVLRAIIKWVKKQTPKKIIVAESSGTANLHATESAFKVSGIQKICEQEAVEWIPFEKTQREIYKVKNPLVLDEIVSSTLLEEADVIINIPKIKTHWQCTLTCCIKNMFGTLILGNKAKIHARFTRLEDFSAALADIYSVSTPELTVIDGFLCQEGDGPAKGDVVKMNLIISGYDPVALDSLVCKIIGIEPAEVKYIKKAEEKGLGNSKLENFELLGEKLDNVYRKFKRAKLKPISVPLPKWLADYLSNVIFRARVKFNSSKCKLCSTCWTNCPGDAISPPEKLEKGNVPEWNKNKCIFCYCCAELCPHEAVDFKINYVRNFIVSKAGIVFLLIIAIITGTLFWIFL